MPATHLICPDKQVIAIHDCLKLHGCRMEKRCATLPYLRMASFDREFKGISPSSAGNGPRQIYLKAVVDYAIDPMNRTWATLGTAVHTHLSALSFVENVLEEEPLEDAQMRGIADIIEIDENNPKYYLLTDYKTFGSFKVAKCLGISSTKKVIMDHNGAPVLLKTGKNKGKPKLATVITCNPKQADLANETMQLNRYRIFFENNGFPISQMRLQVIVRDGGLFIAKSRGIMENLYIIPIPKLDDTEVLYYYHRLKEKVDSAFKLGWAPRCTPEESWDGRRCDGFCEVSDACSQMDENFADKVESGALKL